MGKTEITELLHAWGAGDGDAGERLFALVGLDLRRLARARLAGESRARTLGTTALVHEAYLRLAADHGADWRDRRHFFAACANAMRRVLVDRARRRRADKRGGGAPDLPFDDQPDRRRGHPVELLALDRALERLARARPRACRVVELRYFLGLSIAETADALGIAERTVKQDWTLARAHLFRQLGGEA